MEGLVLSSYIGSRAIKTDPRVVEYAASETPVEKLVSELDTNKTDFYYKKARKYCLDGKSEKCVDYLCRALDCANDSKGETLRLYISGWLERILASARGSGKMSALLEEKEYLIQSGEGTISDLKNQIHSLEDKIKTDNAQMQRRLKLLLDTVKGKESEISKLGDENNTLKQKMQEADEKNKSQIAQKDQKIGLLEENLNSTMSAASSYKKKTDMELSENKKEIDGLHDEVKKMRMRKNFWKIFFLISAIVVVAGVLALYLTGKVVVKL